VTHSPSDPTPDEVVPGDEASEATPDAAPQEAADAPAGEATADAVTPDEVADDVAAADEAPSDDESAADEPAEAPADEPAEDEEPEEPDELALFAAGLADRIGATSWTAEHATVRLTVERERWVESVSAVGEELPFFSWLSAIDWSREVAVGEVAENAAELEERYEVLCRMSSVRSADAAMVVTTVPKDDPTIDTLVGSFGGAEWHEREAAEMFGIEFVGHPNLTHLYLPDAFEGHPLRKSFALLSREVKPWPGTVDVEGLPSADGPSTDNVEAGDGEAEEGSE
jgi:NADH-quinone oxidoreductase subunit C